MLKESVKFLLKDTLVYGIGGIVARFFAIFTVPIVTRVLSQSEYGTVDAAMAFVGIFASLIILGQDSAIARFFYDKGGEETWMRDVASTSLLIQLILMVIGLVVFLMLSDDIGRLIYPGNSPVAGYWKVALLGIPGSAMLLFSINIFKWTFQKTKFLIISLGSTIFTVALTVYLVAYLRWGVIGAILPNVFSGAVFGIFGIILNRRYISFGNMFQNTRLARKMAAYGLPCAGVMLVSSLIPSVDRFFLLRYADLSQIGIYAVGVKVASLILLAVGAFQIAFGPYAFSIWDKKEAPEVFAKLFKLYIMGLSFIAVILCALWDVIIMVFASGKYASSFLVLPLLLMSHIFQGATEFTSLGVSWAKKMVFTFVLYTISTAILFMSNYLLVPYFTIVGAALSLLIANICLNVLYYLISTRFYRIRIDFKAASATLVIAGLVFALSYLDYYFKNNVTYIVKTASVFCFPVACFFAVFSSAEREGITQYVRKSYKQCSKACVKERSRSLY